MLRNSMMTLTFLAGFSSAAVAADFDAGALHEEFMGAFNDRQWEQVKSMLAEDSVFHRANAAEVYSGPDAIVDHFEHQSGASGTSSSFGSSRRTRSPALTDGWWNAATSQLPRAPTTAPAMPART